MAMKMKFSLEEQIKDLYECFESGSQVSSGNECLNLYTNYKRTPMAFKHALFKPKNHSISSINSFRMTRHSGSVLDERKRVSELFNNNNTTIQSLFGNYETAVYMTLFNEFCRHHSSGTQATASINKCLQVNKDSFVSYRCASNTLATNSNICSSYTMCEIPYSDSKRRLPDYVRYSDIYFFGRKKDDSKLIKKSSKSGMGSSSSRTSTQRLTATPARTDKSKKKGSVSTQAKSRSSSSSAQTDKSASKPSKCSAGMKTTRPDPKLKKPVSKTIKGSSAGTATPKAVSIKDDKCKDKEPCPAAGVSKGDMMATVSHIRIGPKQPCPLHGKDPCQGPKCIVASSDKDNAPVKISTVTNPRRGVFELVIRRITGAPLARNELMLEWTPPPSRPPPCGSPCPIPCSPPGPCRPSKCKMVVCRPSPCKPKCKRPCKRPCGPMTCRAVPCKKCCKSICCSKPCRPCEPCPPIPACLPCSPSPCTAPCFVTPCCKKPCSSPCKSSPCLRPCPVSWRRPRRSRSQPKIRARKKRISPCCNRSYACPVVRCRSAGPCIRCCPPIPCPPRKCCSVSPCQPPRHCKSACSTCCA